MCAGSAQRTIRIMIADDHPAFREGLARLLTEEGGFECVAQAQDGAEAVQKAKELKPEVALLDASMPGISGVEAARQIKASCPHTAVLVVSAFDAESYMLPALQAGASGYVLKNTPISDLVAAIRLVAAGESMILMNPSPKIIGLFSGSKDNEGRDNSHRSGLQPREKAVLKLAAQGMSNRQIAAQLVISERTVHTHLHNLYRKIGATSRTQAVLRALRQGWLEAEDAGPSGKDG